MWPGMALSVEIESIIDTVTSPFQQIDIYRTKGCGKMLVIDGIIQLTESDEFAYHEMMTHVPLFAHPEPENILVIGGGDGGVLREAARHDTIRSMDICEIDGAVVEMCRTHLPGLACGFDDPRVTVHIEDGHTFLDRRSGTYDVIIVDSSDPVGPGEKLFEAPFYARIKAALKPGGIVAAQGESVFLHRDTVISLARTVRSQFTRQAYATVVIPSYPGGNIGICLGSLGPELTRPCRRVPEKMAARLNYYSEPVHTAAFILPRFARDMLDEPENA